MAWIDVTRRIDRSLPLYPGDDRPRERPFRLGGTRMTKVQLWTHSGTHVDFPAHVLDGADTLDEAAVLRALLGAAWVCRLPRKGGNPIGLDVLRRAVGGRPPARLLLRTDPGGAKWRGLDPSAARWLAGRCRLVGTDAVSIDPPGPDLEAHRRLLGAGTLILENLLLERVASGPYHLVALPLRLTSVDGAPVRALLRR
jgi:arylformamidase